LREWVGRGASVEDPYDPALVRGAPREIRRTLADALAEEATARIVGELGIGFTIWHDVSTGHPEDKLDHVVLGPTGLWGILSEDFGGPVRVRRGELIGEAVAGERPFHELAARAKALARQAKVKFSGLVVVVPDEALDEPWIAVGAIRGATAVVVRPTGVGRRGRDGMPGARPVGGNELFDVRTRLAASIRFV
jgi:hypothetical protein